MDGLKSFFDSFKEFIWDIIGYLFPGLFTIVLLSVCINPKYFYNSSLDELGGKSSSTLILFISYILGYVIYGYSELKEKFLKERSYMKEKEREIASKVTFIKARDILVSKLPSTSNSNPFSSIREVRNIVMSMFPENDQKVYTFMFRSELARHVSNVSITLGVLGLVNFFISFFSSKLDLFIVGIPYVILYVALICSYIFLRETRNRFYAIAMGLPFSYYLSKQVGNVV